MESRGNGKNGHSSSHKPGRYLRSEETGPRPASLTDPSAPKSQLKKNWKSRLYDASERVFDAMLAAYDWSLKKAMKYHRTTMVISAVILVATAYLFAIVPKGFIPNGGTGQITATTQAAQDISFNEMVKHQQEVADIVRRDPNVEGVNSSAGAGEPNAAANLGRLFIRLKPPSQRQVKPQVKVEINRDQASAYGLTANQIETALNNAYGSRQWHRQEKRHYDD